MALANFRHVMTASERSILGSAQKTENIGRYVYLFNSIYLLLKNLIEIL